MGLQLTVRAYQVYIASVLLFVGQFDDLPESFANLERKVCQKLFPCLNYWVTPAFLKGLKSIGFPVELSDVSTAAVAAKSRLFRCEDARNGGLRVHERASRLRGLSNNCSLHDQFDWALPWINKNILFRLEAADHIVSNAQHSLAD